MPPPPLLRVAGHPLRWQLLAELGRSDRRVHELTGLTGQPQNLVSYHLAALRRAELVSGRRSAADGRDTYYRIELPRLRALFTEAGAALHPGLRLRAEPPPMPVAGTRVLFLCTGNSARSPLAAAAVAARSAGAVTARSAGSHPKALHPAVARIAAGRYGIDLAGHRPTHVDDVAGEVFDRVVTLCDKVREVCPELPAAGATAHWSLPDPAADAGAGDDAFERTADELEARIDFLLADLADPAAPIPTPEDQP